MDDDGLYLPDIRAHSVHQKFPRHNYYATLFARAMARRFAHIPYIGLYSGAGRARLQPTGEIVETSAMSAIRLAPLFTQYIFVDADARCTSALKSRIEAFDPGVDATLINKPVNDAVPDIISALPSIDRAREEGLLGLCYIDPFRIDLDFDVIRRLSRYRFDFLIMFPWGFDVRRNLRSYLYDETDDSVGRLIDAPDWRDEWRERREPSHKLIRFVGDKFDEAMARLRYRRRGIGETVDVKVTGMGVYLYSLAFYSRHERGTQFWKSTLAGTSPQGELDLQI